METKSLFTSRNDCFVNLPIKITDILFDKATESNFLVIQLSFNNKNVYVSWSNQTSKSKDYLEIDATFAKLNKIGASETISISLINNPNVAKNVEISPLSPDDWEILELNAEKIEQVLLSQIRVVFIDERFTICLNGKPILVKVVNFDAVLEGYANLTQDTEIYVKPVKRGINEKNNTPLVFKKKKLRICKNTTENKKICLINPLSVFEYNDLIKLDQDIFDIEVCALSSLKIEKINENLKLEPTKTFNKRVALRVQMSYEAPLEQLLVPQELMRWYKLKEFEFFECKQIHKIKSKFWIQPLYPSKLKKEKEEYKKVEPTWISEVLKEFLNINSSILLSHELIIFLSKDRDGEKIIPLRTDIIIQIKFQNTKDFGALYASSETKFEEYEEKYIDIEEDPVFEIKDAYDSICPNSATSEKIELCYKYLLSSLYVSNYERNENMANSSLLICGSKGSGKKFLCNKVLEKLKNNSITPSYVVNIKCNEFNNDKIETIKNRLKKHCLMACRNRPSILYFDKIDILVKEEAENEDPFRSRQIAHLFIEIVLNCFKKKNNISVIATCNNKQNIHTLISKCHMFNFEISIKPPDLNSRKEILENMFKYLKIENNIDFLKASEVTQGFSPADLKIVSERSYNLAMTNQILNKNSNKAIVGINHLIEICDKYTPISLANISLFKSNIKWSEIGGLSETKKILKETLEWPVKYSRIFNKCPLRLRSGLLLYGYPGCGKTILASAIANEFQLNFISVKGPEVLNKYIGASEKSIRDLFDRAQAAKPAILFFDEFDSIAPKRGSDSTGVTDRVVNQLLTQMDGAEGLDGVYVLAATSRPDLLDPALLRPGRLDKSLLCGIPKDSERVEILKIVSQKFILNKEIDFDVISKKCHRFTSADIQALLYNSYLEAVHEVIDKKPTIKEESDDEIDIEAFDTNKNNIIPTNTLKKEIKTILKNTIQQKSTTPKKDSEDTIDDKKGPTIELKHIEKALKYTHSSIQESEQKRLEKIYNEFAFGKTIPQNVGNKSTLG